LLSASPPQASCLPLKVSVSEQRQERLTVRVSRNSLTVAFIAGVAALVGAVLSATEMNDTKFFFEKEPYIHPKIIEDLTTWLSDSGEQVVAINLLESMNTNRYIGDLKKRGKGSPFIFYERTEECQKSECPFGPPSFGYQFIGKSASGIYVLITNFSGGGSGQFKNLLLVSLEKDKGLSYDEKSNALRLDRERWIIKKLAEIGLGDWYEGKISVKGNVLRIGKDQYPGSAGLFNKDTTLKIEVR
jgi:hypothetical protein